MRNFNDLLRKSSSFFIIAIIEWIYFPFGLIKAILKCLHSNYDLNRFGVQELFKKMNMKRHIITLCIGVILIVISLIIYNFIDETYQLFIVSEIFFFGVLAILSNINLKKTFSKIMVVVIVILFLIFNCKVKVFFGLFTITLIGSIILFKLREAVVTFLTLMLFIFFISIIILLIIIYEKDFFNKYPYSLSYSIITFILTVYLYIGYSLNRKIIKIYFDEEDVNNYSREKFSQILTLFYILVFILLNISGNLYHDGEIGKLYNIFNNCFLTVLTITQITGKDKIIDIFKIRLKEIKGDLLKFIKEYL
ncbi:hypothetical protein KWQ95_018985 [Clostridioides difficile]|nr:hypothetical protein [Clostridioides difficile]MDI3116237.1 hypothetical protein [Clostridioides difficile]HBG0353080.1 hypothetical protein [Clostridioides difficile]